eukprot:CAMPEP_0167788186 /NCGR_PEP_ID=MMETSP0111_2-20121227/9882_1 /TAXON_ID=91324 /ORGANISM="Lotharella globosa, Strain CCCM811" /LENGTH=127 /DNA_ID=CAMNT_0007679999 /DNA_START=670 /DNA_END=1053 /DNA_ORIENTATION=+
MTLVEDFGRRSAAALFFRVETLTAAEGATTRTGEALHVLEVEDLLGGEKVENFGADFEWKGAAGSLFTNSPPNSTGFEGSPCTKLIAVCLCRGLTFPANVSVGYPALLKLTRNLTSRSGFAKAPLPT